MIGKTNLYVLLLLLLLVQLTIGCGGTRRGLFMQVNGGIAAVSANEERIERKYHVWTERVEARKTIFLEQTTYVDHTIASREIGRTYHSDWTTTTPGMVFSLKIGCGVFDRLLVSYRWAGYKLHVNGIGLTYFIKKTAPSLYFDIAFPMSIYETSLNDVSLIDHLVLDSFWRDTMTGRGAIIGIGYENWNNFTAQVDFSLGVYSSDRRISFDADVPNTPPTHIETDESVTEAVGYSVAFTIGYIWY